MSKTEVKFEQEHMQRVDQYANKIEKLFVSAVQKASMLGASISNIDFNKPFSFSDYPQTRAGIGKIVNDLFSSSISVISGAVKEEWLEACNKNDGLVEEMAQKVKLSTDQLETYQSRNLEALSAFQKRKENGLSLSDNVWRYTNQFKGDIEMGLDLGLGEGKSAAELSRDIRNYLQEPDKLFRRVRNKRGDLVLSEMAKRYSPGEGAYRSSYKNALRLARTEINMAYRSSDYESNQNLDFVVGQEIKRSNHVFACPVCESLKGKYPKWFKFTGWHPQCRCFSVSILATLEEFTAMQMKMLRGDDNAVLKSRNEVKDIPNSFTNWVKENEDRIRGAKGLPYFLQDNSNTIPEIYVSISKRYAVPFTNKSKRIAEKLGISVTDTSIKSDVRILEKAKNDYNGYVGEVKDIIRNTFVLRSNNQMNEVVDEIGRSFEIVRIKKQLAKVDPLGYSGVIINVKTSASTFGEIQLNTAQVLYAKHTNAAKIIGQETYDAIHNGSGLESGLGHKFYEEYRVLNNRDDRQRMRDIEKRSKEYYAKIKAVKL